VCWLRRLIEAAGDRLFRADDQRAIEHNWRITRRIGGLSRSYRDPRFDTLRPCPPCNGDGGIAVEPCVSCDGTGRVIQPAVNSGGHLQ
jgi:hypothetical protein